MKKFYKVSSSFSQSYSQHDQRYGYQDYRQPYSSDYSQVPTESSGYTAGAYDRSYQNYGEWSVKWILL